MSEHGASYRFGPPAQAAKPDPFETFILGVANGSNAPNVGH
ncbi:hypothetical protein [Mesorhizobium sp.]|nr:hypothetical protein [Mesorhizobium sp.]